MTAASGAPIMRARLSPTGSRAMCTPPDANAVRWTALNNGYGVTQFYHGSLSTRMARLYLGGTQDNGTILGSDEAGADGWRPIYGGDGGFTRGEPAGHADAVCRVPVVQPRPLERRRRRRSPQFAMASTRCAPTRSGQMPTISSSRRWRWIPAQPQRLWLGGEFLYRDDQRSARRDGPRSVRRCRTAVS